MAKPFSGTEPRSDRSKLDVDYQIVPDDRFFWHGPATAAGVFVWGHGNGSPTGAGPNVDERGRQPPPYARALNDAGFDIIRFDRDPNADNRNRAAGWLADTLAKLPVLCSSDHRHYRGCTFWTALARSYG